MATTPRDNQHLVRALDRLYEQYGDPATVNTQHAPAFITALSVVWQTYRCEIARVLADERRRLRESAREVYRALAEFCDELPVLLLDRSPVWIDERVVVDDQATSDPRRLTFRHWPGRWALLVPAESLESVRDRLASLRAPIDMWCKGVAADARRLAQSPLVWSLAYELGVAGGRFVDDNSQTFTYTGTRGSPPWRMWTDASDVADRVIEEALDGVFASETETSVRTIVRAALRQQAVCPWTALRALDEALRAGMYDTASGRGVPQNGWMWSVLRHAEAFVAARGGHARPASPSNREPANICALATYCIDTIKAAIIDAAAGDRWPAARVKPEVLIVIDDQRRTARVRRDDGRMVSFNTGIKNVLRALVRLRTSKQADLSVDRSAISRFCGALSAAGATALADRVRKLPRVRASVGKAQFYLSGGPCSWIG